MARDSIEVDIGGERTPVEALIGVQRPDLVLLNDRDLSYVKVRLDPGSLRTVHGHLAELRDPLARAVVWTILWDTWRDGELSSADYLGVVLAGLSGESDVTAIINQLRQLQLAVT